MKQKYFWIKQIKLGKRPEDSIRGARTVAGLRPVLVRGWWTGVLAE